MHGPAQHLPSHVRAALAVPVRCFLPASGLRFDGFSRKKRRPDERGIAERWGDSCVLLPSETDSRPVRQANCYHAGTASWAQASDSARRLRASSSFRSRSAKTSCSRPSGLASPRSMCPRVTEEWSGRWDVTLVQWRGSLSSARRSSLFPKSEPPHPTKPRRYRSPSSKPRSASRVPSSCSIERTPS